MSTVTSIVYTPKHDYQEPADHYLRVPVSTAELVAGHGIRGDRKGSNPERGLNVMSAEILADLAREGFQAGPGQMGEQLVISGLDFASLTEGTCLQIGGEATIKFIVISTGCVFIEHFHTRLHGSEYCRAGILSSVGPCSRYAYC